MVAFALLLRRRSCSSSGSRFGGSVPLQPQGYRVTRRTSRRPPSSPRRPTCASPACTVGKVSKSKVAGRTRPGRSTDAMLEIDAQLRADRQGHARDPAPEDAARRDLRGAARPADRSRRHDPGRRRRCRTGRWRRPSQLDEIFRTFDPKTRSAFQHLDRSAGHGGSRHAARTSTTRSGNLTPFAENTDDVLRSCATRARPTRRLVRNTGVVFDALSERQGQLRELITNSNRVFADHRRARPAARRRPSVVLPDVPARESQRDRCGSRKFANNTNPLITQLRPAARQLSPTLISASTPRARPEGPVRGPRPAGAGLEDRACRRSRAFLDNTRPVLAQTDPFLRDLNPFLD